MTSVSGGHPWRGQSPVAHVRTRNVVCGEKSARATFAATAFSDSDVAVVADTGVKPAAGRSCLLWAPPTTA